MAKLIQIQANSNPSWLESIVRDPRPRILEIGTGKGKFLSLMAELHPQKCFIGVEKSPKWLKVGFEKAIRKKQDLLFVSAYIEDLLREHFPYGFFDEVYVLFPDPWPKSHHQRRRVLSDENVKMIWHILKEHGSLCVGTDYKDYFESLLFNIQTKFGLSFAPVCVPTFECKSNFQLKYEREGRPLYFVKLSKLAMPPFYDFPRNVVQNTCR